MAKLLNCNYCKKDFYSKCRNSNAKYCSKYCAGKDNKSLTRFTNNNPVWNKGLKGWNKGHGVSAETRLKISKANTKLNPKSTRNRLIRKSTAFMNWRHAVFERDNYTCQKCGLRSQVGQRVMLHPHHLMPLAKYPELAFEISNGQTLCAECHQEVHYGIKLSKNLTGQKAVKL